MKYYLITGRIPASETEGERDSRIEIGESNSFDTSGKPFMIAYHPDLGIKSVDDWKRLITLYGSRIVNEYLITKEGLRQDVNGPVIPGFHFIGLLHDGFSKTVSDDKTKIIYSKQKGRIEDETGRRYTVEEMFGILEGK